MTDEDRIWFWRQQADYRHDHKTGKHHKGSGIDRGLQQRWEKLRKKHVGNHHAASKEKTCPAGSERGFSPIQGEQEGG